MRRLLVVIALAAAACTSNTTSPAPSIGAVATPMQFSGSGQRASDPFDLGAGDYRFDWSVDPTPGGCFFGVSLDPIGHDEPLTGLGTELMGDGDPTKTGSAVRRLAGGRYVVSVTDCSWKVTITKL